MLHPDWAAVDCRTCLRFVLDKHGDMTYRGKVPQRRPKESWPPCHECPKVPAAIRKKVTQGYRPGYWDATELSERNRAAWHHYQECAAVGEFPDDPIVRRNAALLRNLEAEAERHFTTETMLAMFKGMTTTSAPTPQPRGKVIRGL